MTYVPTVQGWLYLACVTDVFSRMVLGWSMASHRKTQPVVDRDHRVRLFDQQPGGRFETRREAKLAVFDYLETFYDRSLAQRGRPSLVRWGCPTCPPHDAWWQG